MRRLPAYLLVSMFLAVSILLSIAIGPVFIPPSDLWRILTSWLKDAPLSGDPGIFSTILLVIRLPHMLLFALTGAALSGSGAAYQGLFRNPLADPYLIGVSSGAGLGAVLAMGIDWPYSFWGLQAIPLSAFCGALLSVFLVYMLARVGRTIPTTNLLLAGVAVSFFTSALTSFLMLQAKNDVRRPLVWLLGGGSQAGWQPVLGTLPYVALGVIGLLLSGHALNVLQFGDDQAQQMGLRVTLSKTLILIAASMATAAAVAYSGIIGFIGLIVPHVIRMWFGTNYRRLLPLSMIAGAGTLLLADVLARVVLRPQELPVGIVTALAGAPFFLWVLRRARNQGLW